MQLPSLISTIMAYNFLGGCRSWSAATLFQGWLAARVPSLTWGTHSGIAAHGNL